ncbi:hypothetical protein ACFV0T_36235 [Streptomyces sp. NPDC059582]|uniref:ISAzo13-like element transposase-related protein n=1 Tax=Streptomyces sp. NPDC059582 TaxID=3346875 RepID=UPI0036A6721B
MKRLRKIIGSHANNGQRSLTIAQGDSHQPPQPAPDRGTLQRTPPVARHLTAHTDRADAGPDHDTAASAVESTRHRHSSQQQHTHPRATQLLITPDADGSPGHRTPAPQPRTRPPRRRNRADDHRPPPASGHAGHRAAQPNGKPLPRNAGLRSHCPAGAAAQTGRGPIAQHDSHTTGGARLPGMRSRFPRLEIRANHIEMIKCQVYGRANLPRL